MNAMDLASEMDRKYFENNPGIDMYVRELIEGEFTQPNLPEDVDRVRVIQVSEGFRLRIPGGPPAILYVE